MNKELSNIMSMTVENLAKTQHEALKQHVIDILDKVKYCIENERYNEIKSLTFHSPEGDGYGMDNDVINFAYEKDDEADLVEITNILINLNNKSLKQY